MNAPHYLRFAQALALVSGVTGCGSTVIIGDAGEGTDAGTTLVDASNGLDGGDVCATVDCMDPPAGCTVATDTPDCCDYRCPDAETPRVDSGIDCSRVDCGFPMGCWLDETTPECCDYVCPDSGLSCQECSCGEVPADAGIPSCYDVNLTNCCVAVGPLLPPDVAAF